MCIGYQLVEGGGNGYLPGMRVVAQRPCCFPDLTSLGQLSSPRDLPSVPPKKQITVLLLGQVQIYKTCFTYFHQNHCPFELLFILIEN